MFLENTPNRRPHHITTCNCRACRRFDYAETVEIGQTDDTQPTVKLSVPQPPATATHRIIRIPVEVVTAIDTETGQHTTYYFPVS
jgi:hypothetical protein